MKETDTKVDMPRGGKRPGAGRPKKYGRAALHQLTNLWATNEQGDRWKKAARVAGDDFQDWIRKALDKEADRILGEDKPTS